MNDTENEADGQVTTSAAAILLMLLIVFWAGLAIGGALVGILWLAYR